MTLDELRQRAGLWRAGDLPASGGLASGFPALDDLLPGGGWPRSGLTEILTTTPGSGALRLVLPALAMLSRAGRWIIWVAPPHVPYSPALEQCGLDLTRMLVVDLPEDPASPQGQALWVYEQALRFPDCGAALLWLDDAANLRLRRLQLAAEAGGTWGLLFRPERYAAVPSPAPLRLSLQAWHRERSAVADGRTELQVTVHKARGASRGAYCVVEL